jgi:hypothetical protein
LSFQGGLGIVATFLLCHCEEQVCVPERFAEPLEVVELRLNPIVFSQSGLCRFGTFPKIRAGGLFE